MRRKVEDQILFCLLSVGYFKKQKAAFKLLGQILLSTCGKILLSAFPFKDWIRNYRSYFSFEKTVNELIVEMKGSSVS